MKKRLLLIMMVPAICIFLILPALSQEEMQVIEDDGFQKRQRPPAVFRHDDHNESAEIEACNECHHIYDNGEKQEDESSEDQLCSECHTGQKFYHIQSRIGCYELPGENLFQILYDGNKNSLIS